MSEEGKYARELGFKRVAELKRRGGMDKLKAMSPEARSVLLKPYVYGDSRAISAGGLAARGMFRGHRGIDTQDGGFLIPPVVEDGQPLEMALTDEVFDGLSVEDLDIHEA